MRDARSADIAVTADVLARHRQEHRPATGDSVCACGEWVGPFTMTTQPGSYAWHLAVALAVSQMKNRYPCPTEGCPGDGRYAAPGRGHRDGCQYRIPPG